MGKMFSSQVGVTLKPREGGSQIFGARGIGREKRKFRLLLLDGVVDAAEDVVRLLNVGVDVGLLLALRRHGRRRHGVGEGIFAVPILFQQGWKGY